MIKTVKELQTKLETEGMNLTELQQNFSDLNHECFMKRWNNEEEKIEMYETLKILQIEIDCIECY